ncbi:carbohydrate ABC transporter permease [Devosia sp. 66-22]|jgi:putative aldouronate transport system permease protein|uniref:carbohydrate ABC transporter permease n=1 Tax=Devosia sp. 66-22 TaxID=1895753 RepID=UPI000AD71019|nr:carbohydrate ABC transporter permease [Devosia sp. 66-22]
MTSIEEPIAPMAPAKGEYVHTRAAIGRTPLERIEYAIIVTTLLAMVVVTVQPILNLLAVSLSDNARVPGMSGLTIIPEGFSLDVWTVLVNHPRVQQGMLNSILITAVGVVINIALTTLMAWGLSRPGLPGRRAVYVLVLVTIVFEPGMLPDYFFNKQFGLLDTYWSVIMYKAVNAWYLIILVRFFEEIPEDLIEAARIDGANPFQTFYMVVLPLAKPAIATIALFYIVFHWNEFFRPLLYLNDQNKWPLQLVLRQFVVEGDKLSIVGLEDMGKYTNASQIDLRAFKAGMILLTIAPILVIYPLILKYFTKGTMTGAVKG